MECNEGLGFRGSGDVVFRVVVLNFMWGWGVCVWLLLLVLREVRFRGPANQHGPPKKPSRTFCYRLHPVPKVDISNA